MKPTAKQLRYLRDLAHLTATTFSPPKTKAQASREIDRLKSRPTSTGGERARERRQAAEDLRRGADDAVRHQPDETAGYGSSARWAHHTDTRGAGR